MVLAGRLKYAAYQDGDVLRAVEDDRQLAFRTGGGKWSRAVQESRPRRPGPFDNVKAVGQAVTVELTKGVYY